jgi:hypothetical protein
MQAIAQVWTTGTCSVAQTPEVIKLRQQGEEQQALERARERVERAVKDLKNKIASENEEVRQIYKQITPTFDPEDPRFHTISARPPKQPRMVGTFLKVHTRPRLAYALRCRGY